MTHVVIIYRPAYFITEQTITKQNKNNKNNTLKKQQNNNNNKTKQKTTDSYTKSGGLFFSSLYSVRVYFVAEITMFCSLC
tara:strand:+ start:2086 stop:2325 length:240 start_codon:yes stop_codon:yes gene_type:complete